MGEPISTTAMIGMAVAAAGAAMQTATTMQKQKQMGDIADDTRKRVEARRKEALSAWEQGLNKLTPEQQRQQIADETAKKNAAYKEAMADAPPQMNIVHTDASTPTIVKTEAAKQLGEKLDMARAQLAGQAKMQGFDANTWLQNLGLVYTGQKVGQQANFMSGEQNAMATDIENVKNSTPVMGQLGDMLSAAGGMMMTVPTKPTPTPIKSPYTSTAWYVPQ